MKGWSRKNILIISSIISLLIIVVAIILNLNIFNTKKEQQANYLITNDKFNYVNINSNLDNEYGWLENMAKIRGELNVISTNEGVNNNLTSLIAFEFLSKNITEQQIGEGLDSGDITEIIDNALGNVNTDARKYSKVDIINTVEKSDNETLRNYGNKIVKILEDNTSSEIDENEYLIFLTAISEDNPNQIRKLDPIITGYEGVIKDSLEIEVPMVLIDLHIKYLNNLEQILLNIRGMRGLFNDAVKALVFSERYLNDVEKFSEVFFDFNKTFTEKEIYFNENEYGYFFNIFSK